MDEVGYFAVMAPGGKGTGHSDSSQTLAGSSYPREKE